MNQENSYRKMKVRIVSLLTEQELVYNFSEIPVDKIGLGQNTKDLVFLTLFVP